MSQMTWRAPEELIRDVERVAAQRGPSVDEFVTQLVLAATDPQHAADLDDRIRERRARSGLLAPSAPGPAPAVDPDAVAAARREAGQGTALSQVLGEGRE